MEHAPIRLTVLGLIVGVLFQLRGLLVIPALHCFGRGRNHARVRLSQNRVHDFPCPGGLFRPAIWARPWLFSIGLLDVARLLEQSYPAIAIDAPRLSSHGFWHSE